MRAAIFIDYSCWKELFNKTTPCPFKTNKIEEKPFADKAKAELDYIKNMLNVHQEVYIMPWHNFMEKTRPNLKIDFGDGRIV